MIIAFTKDWNDVPTSTTHVLREMARSLPVLWVESIGTRRPSVRSGRDLARGLGRLARLVRPPVRKEERLWVLSPVLLPAARSRFSILLNRWLIRRQIGRALRTMGDGHRPGLETIEFWCFVPNAVDLLPRAGKRDDVRDRVIYYCVDDWSLFENLDGQWLQECEDKLLDRADVVFAVSRELEGKCQKRAGGRVHYAPHGVNHGAFARALDSQLAALPPVANLPHPVFGFYGNLSSWIDFGLLETLAGRMPAASFVLAGPVHCDLSRLKRIPNIVCPGRVPYEELPALCKGFDVGIIPYDMNHPRMTSVNPVKTTEMLAAGLPVVAAQLPELVELNHPGIRLCGTLEEWLAALARQAERKDREDISRSVEGEDWKTKVRWLREVVEGSRGECQSEKTKEDRQRAEKDGQNDWGV